MSILLFCTNRLNGLHEPSSSSSPNNLKERRLDAALADLLRAAAHDAWSAERVLPSDEPRGLEAHGVVPVPQQLRQLGGDARLPRRVPLHRPHRPLTRRVRLR